MSRKQLPSYEAEWEAYVLGSGFDRAIALALRNPAAVVEVAFRDGWDAAERSAKERAAAAKRSSNAPLFPEVYAKLLAVRLPNGKPIPRRDATTSTRLARAWNRAVKKCAPEKIVEEWRGYAALAQDDPAMCKALSAWLNDDRFLCENHGWFGKMSGNVVQNSTVSVAEAERAESERLARLQRERDARIEAEMKKEGAS